MINKKQCDRCLIIATFAKIKINMTRTEKENTIHRSSKLERLHEIDQFLRRSCARGELKGFSSDELKTRFKVTTPTIVDDLKTLKEAGAPFASFVERGEHGGKYRYHSYNVDLKIFKILHVLTDEERNKISALIDLVSSLQGVPDISLEGLAHLESFIDRVSRKTIWYEENASRSTLSTVNELYDHIEKRHVISFTYSGYKHEPRKVVLHPRVLKMYDLRFYLLGIENGDENNKINHFPVDRISNIEISKENTLYWGDMKNDKEIESYYQHVVGMTIPEDATIKNILCWVSDIDYKYVMSKPLHQSQKLIPIEESEKLRKSFNVPKGGYFVKITCMVNYELKRELVGYGDGLIVLTPKELNEEISNQLEEMASLYRRALQ